MPDLLPSHAPNTVQRCHLIIVQGISVIVLLCVAFIVFIMAVQVNAGRNKEGLGSK